MPAFKNQYDTDSEGGGAGGKHLPLPVPLLQPPVPFCELSPASRLFCNDLATLLY